MCLGETRACYIGPGLALAPHANAVTMIAVGMQADLQLQILSDAGQWVPREPAAAAIVPAGRTHHLVTSGAVVFVYLDPLTDLSQHDGAARLRDMRTGFSLDAICDALRIPTRRPTDAAIVEACRAIDEHPDRFRTIDDAAALSSLSASRFRARFAAEVGLPFRRYRLWRRMALAMASVAAGDDLTTAAMSAGFASASHFSTAFKSMFGLSPSQLLAAGVAIELPGQRR